MTDLGYRCLYLKMEILGFLGQTIVMHPVLLLTLIETK